MCTLTRLCVCTTTFPQSPRGASPSCSLLQSATTAGMTFFPHLTIPHFAALDIIFQGNNASAENCEVVVTSALVETWRLPFTIVHHGSRRRPSRESLEQTALMAEFLLGGKRRGSRTSVSPSSGGDRASHSKVKCRRRMRN